MKYINSKMKYILNKKQFIKSLDKQFKRQRIVHNLLLLKHKSNKKIYQTNCIFYNFWLIIYTNDWCKAK